MEKENPSVFVHNSEDGMDMVEQQKGKFAFFAETTFITYYTHRNCNLAQIGPKLDSKEYAIAMPMSE